jgi:hypothetical protein
MMQMTHGRESRGFVLSLTACLGGLACGPDQTSMESTAAVTGYPLETGEADSNGDGDGDDETYCQEAGWLCGEFGICQCSGDVIPDSCGCEPVECTEDSHCADEQICASLWDPHFPSRACVPDYCMGLTEITIGSDTDPLVWADETCAEVVIVELTPAMEITGLDNLRYVHGSLNVRFNEALVQLDGLANLERVGSVQVKENPQLTSVAGLAGLQEIVEGGTITNNPLLPTADVEALLAQIPGGDAVVVCGNLDGEPC